MTERVAQVPLDHAAHVDMVKQKQQLSFEFPLREKGRGKIIQGFNQSDDEKRVASALAIMGKVDASNPYSRADSVDESEVMTKMTHSFQRDKGLKFATLQTPTQKAKMLVRPPKFRHVISGHSIDHQNESVHPTEVDSYVNEITPENLNKVTKARK